MGSAPRGEAVFAPGLPVEVDHDGWWRRVGRTLAQICLWPARSFDAVEEPVHHGPALAFIASLVIPSWLIAVTVGLIDWYSLPADSEAPIRQTVATGLVGLQLGQVMAVWSTLMTPLRIPVLYFLVGLGGHVIMALTGGARRSIGASMRALGFALAPVFAVFAALELLLAVRMLDPVIWQWTFVSWTVIGWGLSAIALSRTHGSTVIRGLFVVLVPVAIFAAFAFAGASFELDYLPFLGAPERSPYLLDLPPP